MKKLIFIFLIIIPFAVNAQKVRNNKTNEVAELKDIVENYCGVTVPPFVGGKPKFLIVTDDLGGWELIDNDNNVIEIKTIIKVMNYLYINGWEYVNNTGGAGDGYPTFFFKKKA